MFLIAILLFSACSGPEKKHLPNAKKSDLFSFKVTADSLYEIHNDSTNTSTEFKNRFISSDLFKIIKIAYVQEHPYLVFVVIPPEKVSDSVYIRKVVCTIVKSYDFDSRTDITFYSHEKYANSSDALFHDPGHTLPESEYSNWANRYFLGVYRHQTQYYMSFLLSADPPEKKVAYLMNDCP